MSPENARIFLVEDFWIDQDNAQWALERAGHSVVAKAETLDEALLQIPGLQEKGVNVAVVDGNLTGGDVSGEDGKIITEEIKETHGETIKVVSYSGQKESYGYGDAYVRKNPRQRDEELVKVVTEL